MRLDALSLEAFGPFTDVELDLRAPGLQVIFGENGAGKSTAMRALHGLLFGIPARTTDDWLHDMRSMRVGGCLSAGDGAALQIVRRKGNKETLLDLDGAPITEAALTSLLGATTDAIFESMFGISQAGLREGGDALLRGGGDVGAALFATGIGSGAAHSLLMDLETETRELFASRGQKQKVNAGVSGFKEQVKLAKDLSVSTTDWRAHTKAHEDARAERKGIDAEITAVDTRRAEADRLLLVLSPIAERATVVAELQELAEVPELNETAKDDRLRASANLASARRDKKAATDVIKRRREELESLDAPELLLDRQDDITELNQQIGEVRKGARDLPRLEGELNQQEAEATALLHEISADLEIDAADERRVSVALKARVQELAHKRPILESAITVASESLKRTRADLRKRVSRRDALPGIRDQSALQGVVDEVRSDGDVDRRLKDLRAQRDEATKAAGHELSDLPLVSGDLAEVASLDVPLQKTVERFAKDASSHTQRGDTLSSDAEKVGREAEEAQRALIELELAGDVPTEAELDEARIRRTSGWLAVRAAWLEGDGSLGAAFDPVRPLHESYEASVEDADRTADRLRAEADRAAKKAQLVATSDSLERQMEAIREHCVEHEAKGHKLDEQWRALWAPLSITPLPAGEMLEWLRRHEELLRASREASEMTAETTTLEQRIEAHGTMLSVALVDFEEAALGAGESVGLELKRAEAALKASNKTQEQRESAESEIADLEARSAMQEQDLAEAEAAMATGDIEWAEAVAELQLPPGSSVTEAVAVLAALDSAFEKVSQVLDKRGRIAGICRDATSFEDAAGKLLAQVDPGLEADDVASAISDLQARLGRAQQDQATIAQAEKQIQEEGAQVSEAETLEQDATARLERLQTAGGVQTPEELEAVENDAASRRVLRKRFAELEQAIIEHGAASVESLEGEAADTDHDALTAKVAALERERHDLEEQRAKANQQIGKEEGELERMDGSQAAGAASEQAQRQLAQVREDAERYVKLRLAAIMLRRAIETYRQRTQGPVLTRANELFPELTAGVFDGLRVGFDDKDDPILLAVRSTREVEVERLSGGERDELYLALRVATLEYYFETNTPMPLVLDDLFLNFDDRRARAGFEVLRRLTAQTQVIFFTHHEHLVELANEAIPARELTVHRLPGAQADVPVPDDSVAVAATAAAQDGGVG